MFSSILGEFMKKVFILLLFILLAMGFAHAESFYIKEYQSDVIILKNSILEVEENILVHFISPTHGIIREIPYKYKVKNDTENMPERFGIFGNTYEVKIYDIKVKDFKTKVTKSGNNITIRIGDKDIKIDGDVKYTISYKVMGAFNFFESHSEFYWNVIGTEWTTQIESSNFNIFFPEGFIPTDNEYFVVGGKYGEQLDIASTNISEKIISGYSNRKLLPNEGMTVGIKFPKDFIKQSAFLKFKIMLFNSFAFIIPFIIFIILFFVWQKFGKDNHKIDIVHFRPPKGMTSAEAGVIIDDKADNKDLISLIFFWASHGLIEIEETEKGGFFSKADYILTKISELPNEAKSFEQIIFYGLFPGSTKNVRISTLKDTFYTTMQSAREQLNNSITLDNYYVDGSRGLGKILMVSSIVMIGIGIFLVISMQRFDYLIAMVLSSIITFVFGYIMPKKTEKGLNSYQIIKGFADFVEKVEKPKLKILIAKDPDYYNKMLPFAIALDVVDKWSEKFDDLLKEPPSWYKSYNRETFRTSAFVSSINSSISSMNSHFTSQPSSSGSGSSGFSGGGGGFSGGGFGGGGGSSW